MVTQEQVDQVTAVLNGKTNADQAKGIVIGLDKNSNKSKKKKRNPPTYDITPDEVPFSDQVAQAQEDQAIIEGRAKAKDIIGSRGVELTKENIDILRQRVQANEYNKGQIAREKTYEGLQRNANAAAVWEDATKPQYSQEVGPEINPNTGRPYGTVTEYKPTAVEKYNREIEKLRERGVLGGEAAFITDVAVFGAKELFYEIPKATVRAAARYNIFNPNNGANMIEDAKGVWSFVTTPNPELGQDIKDRPGKYVGIIGANIIAPEATTKALQKATSFVEGTFDAAKGISRSKKGAVFRGGRSSLAGERVSPISNTQKSKQARNQYINPKETIIPNKIIQISGRANVDSRVIERTAPGEVRVTVTRKTPRIENRITNKTIAQIDFKKGSIDIAQDVKYGKGPAKTARQGLGKRPASQISFNKTNLENAPLSSNEYVLVQRQTQKLSAKQFRRQARNAPEAVFNNPADVNGNILQLENKVKNSQLAKAQYEKRSANPRDRIFKQAKARLRKVAQGRLADRRGTYEQANIPQDFFADNSRAIVKRQPGEIFKPQFEGQIERVSPNSQLPATANKVSKQIGTIVDIEYKPFTEDVTVIPPKMYKRIKVKSVVKETPQPLKAGQFLRGALRLGSVSKIKQSQSLLTRSDTKTQSLLKTRQATIAKTKTKSLLATALKTKTKMLPGLVQVAVLKPKYIQVQFTDQESRQKGRSRGRGQSPRQNERQQPPKNIFEPARQRQPRRVVKAKEPPVPKMLFGVPFRPPVPNRSRYELFNVFSRKGGKVIKLNSQPLSKSQASIFAQKKVGNTARASFKFVSAGFTFGQDDKSSAGVSNKYKKNKSGWFVELSKYRIDTPGEKSDIKRRTSIFSAANIKKKVKGIFWK